MRKIERKVVRMEWIKVDREGWVKVDREGWVKCCCSFENPLKNPSPVLLMSPQNKIPF